MIGETYQAPGDIVYQSSESKKYMAGKRNFRVKEIEVYCLREQ